MEISDITLLIAWVAAAAYVTGLIAKESKNISRPVLFISSANFNNGRLILIIDSIGGRAARDIVLTDNQHGNSTGLQGLGAGRECTLELPDEGNSYVELQLKYRDVDDRRIREPLVRFQRDGQGPSFNFDSSLNERGFLGRYLPWLIRSSIAITIMPITTLLKKKARFAERCAFT